MEDVNKIRLTFIGNNASLTELKVMGIPPVGKEFEIGFPRLKVTRKDAILEANDVYEAWIDQIYGNKAVETEIIENKENIIFLYKKDNKRLLKVIVNRKTGIGEIEKRVANKMKYKLRKQKITPYNVMQGAKITPYNVISLEKEEE